MDLGSKPCPVHFVLVWVLIFLLMWQIPVFKGAAKALLGSTMNAGHFHGYDGLGDVPDPNAPGLEMVQKEGAVSAMIRMINENPGEVSGDMLRCWCWCWWCLLHFKNELLALRFLWLPQHHSQTWLWLWGWIHRYQANSEGSTSWEATLNVS